MFTTEAERMRHNSSAFFLLAFGVLGVSPRRRGRQRRGFAEGKAFPLEKDGMIFFVRLFRKSALSIFGDDEIIFHSDFYFYPLLLY